MPIITSKTNQAIRNEFSRRGFLKYVGAAGIGVTVYSASGSFIYATALPAPFALNFGGFAKLFGRFALDIGMSYAGMKAGEYLQKRPQVSQFINRYFSGYLPQQDWGMLQGQNATFVPVLASNPQGIPAMPFFGWQDNAFGSYVSAFTGIGMPYVNYRLTKDEGYDEDKNAGYLIPRQPQSGSINQAKEPERYRTDEGSTQFDYTGNDNEGKIDFTLWERQDKQSGGTAQKQVKTGDFRPFKDGKLIMGAMRTFKKGEIYIALKPN